ncbi:MAG: hypothetical protein ACRDF5_05510 [bacterium]
MGSGKRFTALAVIVDELGKIPEYDAEANRLYRQLRSRRAEVAAGIGARAKLNTRSPERQAARGLSPAGQASL